MHFQGKMVNFFLNNDALRSEIVMSQNKRNSQKCSLHHINKLKTFIFYKYMNYLKKLILTYFDNKKSPQHQKIMYKRKEKFHILLEKCIYGSIHPPIKGSQSVMPN